MKNDRTAELPDISETSIFIVFLGISWTDVIETLSTFQKKKNLWILIDWILEIESLEIES
jgi:hypothetical protein